MSTTILSVHGSHNASVSLLYNGEIEVVEVERWTNYKNAALCSYLPCTNAQTVFDEIITYLLTKCNNSVDVLLTSYFNLDTSSFKFNEIFRLDHHMSHASGAFYQSNFDEAIIVSFDGGGNDGFFNIYHANRKDGPTLLNKFDQDLGFAYMIIADYLNDINKDPLNIGNLVYSGKLMGLCSYGVVRAEWVAAFSTFYEKFNYINSSFIGGLETSKVALPELFAELGVEFSINESRFNGQLAWDLAATTQFVFEQQFMKFANSYILKGLPICITGGCALNVLLNSKLVQRYQNAFYIPPDPSDCGISVGGILGHVKPKSAWDLSYAGVDILDKNNLSKYLNENNYTVISKVNTSMIAQLLNEDYIIGIINGKSEHGPRALGNRSILCKPTSEMKDKINAKVKNREWYRPFAPVVRECDTSKYFNFDGTSPHMSFVAEIKEEYRDILGAVCHNDNTGRLQTVNEQANSFLYSILSEFNKVSGNGVLLNTSFNVDKRPILSTLFDAFKILHETELDIVYYDNMLIHKSTLNIGINDND